MRKRDWCFAAAVLAAGAGWLGYHVCRHPDSVLAQCVYRCGVVAGSANPAVAVVQGAVASLRQEEVLTSSRKVAVEEINEDCVPEEPVPSDPAAGADDSKLAGVIDLDQFPQKVPAPVVIQEEDQAVQTAKVPEMPADLQVPVAGGGEPCDESHVCPQVMPYCPEEEGGKTMPTVPGEENALKAMAQSLFEKMVLESQERQTGYVEESESGEQKDSANQPEPTPCPHDSYHDHHRYSVCPYSGKCIELTEPETTCPVAEPIPAPYAEEQEPKEECQPARQGCKGKKGKCRSHKVGSGGCPSHPDVDTMEFRPSDRNLNEYPGGPY
jgi:hypothetical protein